MSHAPLFREHLCYCHSCARREAAKALAKKCKIKCPVCQKDAERIIVKDAVIEEALSRLRRVNSAMPDLEKLPQATVPNESLVKFPVQPGPSNQPSIEDTSSREPVPQLRRCESATFSWDKRCPICKIDPESAINQENKCDTLCIDLHSTPSMLQDSSLLLHRKHQQDCQEAEEKGNTRMSFSILSKAHRPRDHERRSLAAESSGERDQGVRDL